MTYALIRDGKVAAYPYSFAALRRDNPQVSFPRDPSDEKLAEFGVHRVATAERPVPDLTEDVAEGAPELIGGVWTQAWVLVAAPAEDVAARQAATLAEEEKAGIKADTFVADFLTATPAQVAARIEAQITNLASAKTVITKLALMLLILARREFRE